MEKIKSKIIACLKDEDCHLTAEDILLLIQKEAGAPIDKNLYADLLNKLEEDDQISSMMALNRKLYEAKEENHYHFICEQCGMVRDIYMSPGAVKMITDHAQTFISSQASIDKVNMSFQGLCHKCRREPH